MIQLIAGLANPGKTYEKTRHNAGAWFIEKLASDLQVSLRHESKYHGLYTQVSLNAEPSHSKRLHLLVPSTFMNLSGQSVKACAAYNKIPTDSILIVHDDVDLPVGTIKLKFDGGDGGHNGLNNVIQHLMSKQFYRLRIGIGRPKDSKEVVDYVLKNPSKAELIQIESAINTALEIMPYLINGDMQQAMQVLHTNQ